MKDSDLQPSKTTPPAMKSTTVAILVIFGPLFLGAVLVVIAIATGFFE